MADNNEPLKIRIEADASTASKSLDDFFGKFRGTGVYSRHIAEAKAEFNGFANAVQQLAASMRISDAAARSILQTAVSGAKSEQRAIQAILSTITAAQRDWVTQSTRAQEQYISLLQRSGQQATQEAISQAKQRASAESAASRASQSEWEKQQRERAAIYRASIETEDAAYAKHINNQKVADAEYGRWYKSQIDAEIQEQRRLTRKSLEEHDRRMKEMTTRGRSTAHALSEFAKIAEKDTVKAMENIQRIGRETFQKYGIWDSTWNPKGVQTGNFTGAGSSGAEQRGRGFLSGLTFGSPVLGTLTDGGIAGLGFAGGMAIASAIGRITSTLREGATAWFEYEKSIEQTTVGMRTLLGDAGKADALIKQLQFFAATTPFNFQNAAAAGRRLLGANFKQEEVIPLLDTFGDVVSGFGGTDENFTRVIEVLTKVKNLGRVQRLDLRQFARNFVPAQALLSEGLGVSPKEIEEMTRKGELSADVFVDGFVRALAKRPALREAMTRASRETFSGAFSNLEDALLIAADKSFRPLFNKLREFVVRLGDSFLGADGMVGIIARASDQAGQILAQMLTSIPAMIRGIEGVGASSPTIIPLDFLKAVAKQDYGAIEAARGNNPVAGFLTGIIEQLTGANPEWTKAKQARMQSEAFKITGANSSFVPFVQALGADVVNPMQLRLQASALAQSSKDNPELVKLFDEIILNKNLSKGDIAKYRTRLRELFPNAETTAKDSRDGQALLAWEKILPGSSAEILGATNEVEEERTRKAQERYENSLTNRLYRAKEEAKEFFEEMQTGYSRLVELITLNKANQLRKSIVETTAELGIDMPKLAGTIPELDRQLKYYQDILQLSQQINDLKRAEFIAARDITKELAESRLPIIGAETKAVQEYLAALNKRRSDERDLAAQTLSNFQRYQEFTKELQMPGRLQRQAYQEVLNSTINETMSEQIRTYKLQIEEAVLSGREQPYIQGLLSGIEDLTGGDSELGRIEKHVSDILGILSKAGSAPSGATISTTASGRTYKDIVAFADAMGFDVTSTTGGGHNKGSAHYQGLAADIRTRGKSNLEIENFIAAAKEVGYKVIDERSRPAGQKVWSGPHLHLQVDKSGKTVAVTSSPLMTSEAALPGGASASLPRLWQNFKSSFTGIGAIRDTVQPGANDAREFSLNAARGTRRDQEYADFLRSNPMALFQLLGRGQSIARASYAKSEFETMFNQTRDLELAKLQFGDASSGSARFNREFGNERTISQYNQNTAAIKDLKSAQADLNDALLNGAEYQARVNRQFEAGRVREYAGAIEDYRNVQRELNESNSERFSQIENLRAETDYLREQINLKRENVRLEQELFRVGVITKDEERNATLQAQLDILRRDRDATLSMIRSRAEIADASIYHSQQSTAIVLEHLAKQKSMSEAVADAQITLYEGVAGSLDRGIDKLTKKLGFFGDAIGSILKTITRNVLTGLFMPFLGGGGFGAPQQRGGFNPLSILGSVLGGGGAAGIGGTGGFAGGYGGAGIAGINTLFNVFSQNGGGYGAFGSANGLGNAMGIIGGLAGLFKGGSGGAANVVSGGESFGLPTNFGGGLGGVFAPVTNKLGGLFSKIGLGGIFGKSSAATGPFAGAVASGSATGGGGFLAGFLPQLGLAAPLLGLSLGAGLGGQSRIGNILGGAGGLLVGGGIAAALAPGLFAGLGSAAPLVTGLLANPFTAVVGVGLLVGAKLLGNAKQRKKDEEATGDWLQDAINGIFKLRDQVKAGQTSPDQAKTLFENDILGTFIAQVNTIKTKSVRESRLTNQVRDLRNLYEKEVGTVAVQKKISSSLSNKLVPEFATGGIVPGQNGEPRLVLAHGGEIIINQRQQTSGLIRAAGEAGVPGVAPTRGVASSGERPISLTVTLVAGTDTQSKMFINGVQSKDGFNEVIETLREINRNGDMRSIRKR